MPDTEPTETDAPDEEAPPTLTNWEFIDRVPTVEEVKALLESVPDQWGVRPVDFADYVQALPQNKKVKVKMENDRGRKVDVDQYHAVWTLYMSVAGRIAMLRAAAEVNDWRVDMNPDPGAGGVGGYVESTPLEDLPDEGKAGRIVYREAITIWRTTGPEQECLGSKTGTAWVPARGGQQAAGSNPFEKCETAARGRAIAAWGIGILPGSGVASVEEMQNADSIQRQQQQASGGDRRSARSGPRKTREELIDEALTIAEDVRQRRGEDKPIAQSIVKYGGTIGIAQPNPTDADDDDATGEWAVDWSMWSDGKITQLVGALAQTQRVLIDRDNPI